MASYENMSLLFLATICGKHLALLYWSPVLIRRIDSQNLHCLLLELVEGINSIPRPVHSSRAGDGKGCDVEGCAKVGETRGGRTEPGAST